MPKNRKHGEGSVYFEKSRQKWAVSFFDGLGKRHTKRFGEDEEKTARAYLVEQLNDINHGAFIAPSDVTLGEWAVEWLKVYKSSVIRGSTYEYYVYILSCMYSIANMKMQDITMYHIQCMYQKLLEKISANTVHKVHSALSDVFKKAVEVGIIKKNIMTFIESPSFEKKDIEIFTDEEIEKILKTCINHSVFKKRYAAVLLGALVGLRRGEVLALRYCDIFLESNEIFVRKTLTKKDNKTIIGNPKTRKSIRKLTVIDELTKELRKLIMTLPTRNPDQFVFITANNNFILPSNFDKFWHGLLRNAQVDYKKFHTLRHTYATKLLASGEPIVEVSRRLGHSKISHTLELYGHAMPDYDKTLVENTKDLYKLPL